MSTRFFQPTLFFVFPSGAGCSLFMISDFSVCAIVIFKVPVFFLFFLCTGMTWFDRW